MKTKTFKSTKIELTNEEITNLKVAYAVLKQIYDLMEDRELNIFEIPTKRYGWVDDEEVSEDDWEYMLEIIDKLIDCGELTVKTEEN